MSDTTNVLLAKSVKLTAALAAPHLFTTLAGALPAAGARAHGVARYGGAVGDLVTVDIMGISLATAAAAVDKDAALEVTAAGKVQTKAGSNVVVARALEAASAAGDIIEVLLLPS